ncbi:hypothetical protein CCR75_009626 [Bremia lactucae]|uniref:Uncharacterized protein n=1 Tax=Bremia lactucae TaxID=4779 RepID=A0A976FMS4_BRELC|nr:hypothetical protein CCR75_009626 [Bremia lactucae]
MNSTLSSNSGTADVNTGYSGDNIANANTTNTFKNNSTTDSCTWYDQINCTRPRTCADCLNVQLSGGSCVIDPRGSCISMNKYEKHLAHRYYYMPFQRYFPSSKYNYCSGNDSVCAACSKQWNNTIDSTETTGLPSICTGTGNCICMAVCERADWKDAVLNAQCSSSQSDADVGASMVTRVAVLIIVGVAVAVIVAFVMWGVHRYIIRSRNRRQEMRLPPPSRSTGQQLSLSGWKSLRQNLIDLEYESIGNGQAMTLQHNVQDERSGTAASN